MSGLTRRGFLTGRRTGGRPAMPWALAEDEFLGRCTRCNACIDICPEHIVVRGSGGFPERCTGCGACVAVCPVSAIEIGS